MTKTELEAWAKETFWPHYTALVKTPFATKYKAGSRGDTIAKVVRLAPSSDLRDRILAAITAQIKNRKQLYNACGSMQKFLERTEYQKFYANRNGTTWLNQMGWEDEIPVIDSIIEESPGRQITCSVEGCDNESLGLSVPFCTEHHPDTMNWTPLLRKQFKKMGLTKNAGESDEDWAARIKKIGFNAIRKTLKGHNHARGK